MARLDKPASYFKRIISLIFLMVNRSWVMFSSVFLEDNMPFLGLTNIFLLTPISKSVRLVPVWVCDMLRLRCAAYSGFTVRHAPAYALNKNYLDYFCCS